MAAQQPPVATEGEPEKPFPQTDKQIDDLLKSDYEKNLKDLERMARLVEEVQAGARKSTHHVISLQNLRKLEQIEKLSKSIRGRMRRY
jgi:hypothetical protein